MLAGKRGWNGVGKEYIQVTGLRMAKNKRKQEEDERRKRRRQRKKIVDVGRMWLNATRCSIYAG